MSDDLATVLERLRALKPELALRFEVSAIHVFGSRASGEDRPDSRQRLRDKISWYQKPQYEKPQDWTFPGGSREWRDMIAVAEAMRRSQRIQPSG
jgi:hypothetical protein